VEDPIVAFPILNPTLFFSDYKPSLSKDDLVLLDIRKEKDGELVPATWDEAYGFISERLFAIKKKTGPESIAGLSSARCTNEENYLFQKFMRAVIGTNHIDHCARL